MSEVVKIVMDKNDLQPLADEVKKLRGGNESITLAQMEDELLSVNDEVDVQAELLVQIATALESKAASGSEPILQSKTVTPATSSQTVVADSGYDGLSEVTVNAMPTATQATPSISVNSSGLITASATQTAGYVSAGTKSATKQLTTQAAQTITPGTTNKTIASGTYLTGTQTIKGDANLVSSNIVSGKTIFGVAGSAEVGGTNTSDATAVATEIFEGKTAYVSGGKVTGTFTIASELSTQNDLITQIQTALANKASAEPVLQEKTVTPTADSQTVTADDGYDGLRKVVINGDENLVSENIVSGVSIFGVEGSATSGGSGGSGGDAENNNENIKYFIVQNDLSSFIWINGMSCEPGTSTNIPYDETNYGPTCFFIPDTTEFEVSYTQWSEDEDGGIFEESMSGGPVYAIDENWPFIAGALFDFVPGEHIINNTITFSVIE